MIGVVKDDDAWDLDYIPLWKEKNVHARLYAGSAVIQKLRRKMGTRVPDMAADALGIALQDLEALKIEAQTKALVTAVESNEEAGSLQKPDFWRTDNRNQVMQIVACTTSGHFQRQERTSRGSGHQRRNYSQR